MQQTRFSCSTVHENSGIRRSSVHLPIGSLEVAVGPSLSAKETEAELPPKSLAAQAGLRPKLEDAERKEKKRWQARALGLVWRLRGKDQN